jgi:hypothetical protein
MHPDIDECVRGWYGNKLTRGEILEKLYHLPTLELQLELLSRLPPIFADEAQDSLSSLLSSEKGFPGAHVPIWPPKKVDPEEVERRKANFEAYRQRQRRLLEYLSKQKSSDP